MSRRKIHFKGQEFQDMMTTGQDESGKHFILT